MILHSRVDEAFAVMNMFILFFAELKENIQEVLSNICQRQGVSSVKKLAYLNAIVRLVSDNDAPDYGYRAEEVFCW